MSSDYLLGGVGQSCSLACAERGLSCAAFPHGGNKSEVSAAMVALGAPCTYVTTWSSGDFAPWVRGSMCYARAGGSTCDAPLAFRTIGSATATPRRLCYCETNMNARVQALEPKLPILPDFLESQKNPCLSLSHPRRPTCLPTVHVISGWHALTDEALMPWLGSVPGIEVRSGHCFGQWSGDDGILRWLDSFGGPPADTSTLLLAAGACSMKLLTWQPEYAGRFLSAMNAAYRACRERETANSSARASFAKERDWQICHAQAVREHDAAVGTGGSGREATPPFVLRAVYGSRARIVSALRHPIDRLENAYYFHAQLFGRFGPTPAGLEVFVRTTLSEFARCERAHGGTRRCAHLLKGSACYTPQYSVIHRYTRYVRCRCAHLFEALGPEEESSFWHCNQLIRGLYAPFVSDWHAAFGSSGLLVVRVDALVDDPAPTRARLLRFIGLEPVSAARSPADSHTSARPHGSYAAMHAASLNATCCGAMRPPAPPMLRSTRALLDAFYRPHNAALGRLLGDAGFAQWRSSGDEGRR